MNAVVWPGKLSGTVQAPPSKSCAHRLLIAAALADRPVTLTGLPMNAAGQDVAATVSALTALGARFESDKDHVLVTPIDRAALDRLTLPVVGCGESGSTLRFMLPVVAALGVPSQFTGEGRLPERPIGALAEQMIRHGAVFEAGIKLPFTVSGTLRGGVWELPGDVSSQFVSGLLFALPMLAEDSRIELTGPLESSGYVDLTISTLEAFGVRAFKDGGGYSIPGGQTYRAPDAPLAVEGDWSGAAFWYGANALGSDIKIEGLSANSWQPDRAVSSLIDALILGANTLDLSGVPDLTPIMAIIAAGLRLPVRLTGLARLRLKESDRVKAIAQGLHDLHIPAIALPDALIIPRCDGLTEGAIDAFDDHRIAMAFAIAGTAGRRSIAITGAECVAKSYASFWDDLKALGGQVRFMSIMVEPNDENSEKVRLVMNE
ncbi:3-phosphoshikimate 1-carboxyvinyltransferase [Clostridia bacterium]|nr:3-phosphoshikimate 1-carboxyvinyltransferase [Clostridia bacterium]